MQHNQILKHIRNLWVLKTLLITMHKTDEQIPVRLGKNQQTTPKKKRINWKINIQLILVIIIMKLIIILTIILFTTGCMESTTYYNGRIL